MLTIEKKQAKYFAFRREKAPVESGLNGVQSEEMTILSGIPQGSVLGPLLFILYINDIQHCSELISIVLFADDTNILYSHTCLKLS